MDKRNPMAGGFIMAVTVMTGFFIGAARGQMSAGFVGGLAVGGAIALGIWLVDRRRS